MNSKLKRDLEAKLQDGWDSGDFDDILDAAVEFVLADRKAIRIRVRKQTATKIFSLAHKYARDDDTMLGAEQLRGYHYFNAIHKIGEFEGR